VSVLHLSRMIPVIAIVGRPNVGKSTLFNQLTRSRQALVVDMPGVTRDRLYGEGKIGNRPFIVIDTGGLANFDAPLETKMADQSWQAILDADIIFFMVDGRAGCLDADITLANKIRLQEKPIFLLVNKTDGLNPEVAVADFYSLGLGDPIAIAASHGRGLQQLVTAALGASNEYQHLTKDPLQEEEREDSVSEQSQRSLETSDGSFDEIHEEDAEKKHSGIKVAMIGRPNVGKSTLVNRILGEERVLVFDEPGTTRDSIYIPFERQGHLYTIIDTAGVRRKGRVHETVEKFSVVKTLQAIEACDVVISVLDAREGVTEQDLNLLGFVLESGRSLVIAINKWDGLSLEVKQNIKKSLRYRLSFVDYAKIHFISALHGSGVGLLFKSVQEAYHAATKELSTSQVNRVLMKAVSEHAPPMVHAHRIKLRYAHVGGHRPPVIIVHGNQTEHVPDSYRRYLMNTFRKAFRLVGTPVRLEFKTSDNPYKGRRNTLTPRQIHKRKRVQEYRKKK